MNKIKKLALALLFLSACQKEKESVNLVESDLTLKNYSNITNKALLLKTADNLNLQMSNSKKDDGKLVSRPLKSSGSGTISYILNGCGDGTLKFQSTGTGNSSHLGRQEQITSFCMDPATGEILSPIVGIGKSANGDLLNYTFIGQGKDTISQLTYQDYIFSGGTGRFANASGSVRLLYSVNTQTNYEFTGSGTITY